MPRWFVGSVVFLVALMSTAHPASAHDKVDQSALGPTFGITEIQGLRLEQTFRPEASTLSGVGLGIARINGGDGHVTVTIRYGDSTGPIIGASTAFWADPAPGQPFDYLSPTRLVHFDFASDLAVIPGQTYVIQADADSAGPGWASLGYDAYPDGGSSFLGRPSDSDFIFQTCGNGAGKHCKSKTIILEKLKKAHGPDCVDFDSHPVCER